MKLNQFKKEFDSYVPNSKSATSEAGKAFWFLHFLLNIFNNNINADNPHKIYPKLEKYVKSKKTILIKGRIDALLGNVIIEFEKNLKQKKKDEAESQLKRYTSILWNNYGSKWKYRCIATDGLTFLIYTPRSSKTKNFMPKDIELEPIDSIDITQEKYSIVFKRFERYFRSQDLNVPTGEDIVRIFGKDSKILKDCMKDLEKAHKKIESKIQSIYEEWEKYLRIVFGDVKKNKESRKLFLKQTYLATLTKFMVYCWYEGNALPTDKEVLNNIIEGGVFRKFGIQNFLIEDFFSWISKKEINKIGIKISTRILDGLEKFDLSKLDQDIFKEIYQEIIDSKNRHDLGEVYTPDWLAELIIERVVKPSDRVLDPSCGSGTFLAACIRYKINKIKNVSPAQKLKNIRNSVFGIDIHPLAVLISKANYLMALGDLVEKKDEPIIIPVYMADSIIYPKPQSTAATLTTFAYGNSEKIYRYPVDENIDLVLPQSIAHSDYVDEIMEEVKNFAINKNHNKSFEKSFQQRLKEKFNVHQEQFKILLDTANNLAHLIKNNKDTIHSFILKNIYKPSTIGKFDILIGNPPWLTYKDVKSVKRQTELKDLIVKKYQLLDSSKAKLLTHMEQATLFFVKCTDEFLMPNGKIGFVLPRSVFASDQHEKFRKNTYKTKIGYWLLFDLEKNQKERVSPLFSTESCVVFGSKDKITKYPIKTEQFSCKPPLPKKNCTLPQIRLLKKQKKFFIRKEKTRLNTVGDRTSWYYLPSIKIKKSQSYYMSKFKQGATLVPNLFWFIEFIVKKRRGIDPQEPLVQSSARSLEFVDKQYKGILMKQNVEKEYLYGALLGSDVFPFCNKSIRPIVLPITPKTTSYKIEKKDNVLTRGHKNMYEWLSKAENHWKRIKGEKAKKMNIYQRIDRSRGITTQSPKAKHAVIYKSAGRKNLVSCFLPLSKDLTINVNGNKIVLNGFIAEHKMYVYYPKSLAEAHYLTAVLNSDTTFIILSSIKAARDIEGKVWELPIPEFDEANSIHQKLSRLGLECAEKAKKLLKKELNKESSVDMLTGGQTGKIIRNIKKGLNQEMKKTDHLVKSLLIK